MTLDTGSIVKIDEKTYLFITSVDVSENKLTAKVFSTREEAVDFNHEVSLKQLPKWHKDNCERCKK